MKPILLEMTAFGSYAKKTSIDFDRLTHGLYLITGDTEAGKTTIFDTIMFAPYGAASGQAGLIAEDLRQKLEHTGRAVCPVCRSQFSAGQRNRFAPLSGETPTQEDVPIGFNLRTQAVVQHLIIGVVHGHVNGSKYQAVLCPPGGDIAGV